MINFKKNYQIMGIVNTTPDSFSDGGKYQTLEKALQHAQQLIEEGADILDIGGQSTRPGYHEVSSKIEMARVINLIKEIRKISSIPLSVDTYYPTVAEVAIQNGASIINDIKGLDSPRMAETVASYPGIQLIIMHSRKRKDTILVEELQQFYEEKIRQCQKWKIPLENICFDPGIGFHKTLEENSAILKNPSAFRYQEFPLLIGLSRKRIIGLMTGEENPIERDFGSVAASLFVANQGVELIRTHNVKSLKQAFDVWTQLKK
ncbi:dihydropteroate synthase [Carnobacterium gallinarum]|uniref:dihydropteroate synthase n=1 Tax=Carnobacterium gallinarum TaxID=2749 RepID=UPI00054F43A8|nr:dihydropteroate synthase [Carnobacterium gallinarum]